MIESLAKYIGFPNANRKSLIIGWCSLAGIIKELGFLTSRVIFG
jgi:hypothetical protein